MPDDVLRLVLSEPGADAERLDAVTGYLQAELVAVDDVEVARGAGEAPEGTRAVDPVEVGTLLVTLLTSQALAQVVGYVRRWLRRGSADTAEPGAEPSRSVRLEIDGDVLELTDVDEAQQQQLVQLFVLKHVRPDPS